MGFRGRGAYGAVYRAERVGHEEAGPVALKLALHPRDPRFAREVALLSRLKHPNVPALHAQGVWALGDRLHPFLVMQWVEGTPLYDWSSARNPTSRQVMRLLAQVARAVAATHAAGGVHRDVKGDNILVRPEDGRAFLVDFGSSLTARAAPLTWHSFPPGTAAYRSPEAWQFALSHRSPDRYVSRPPDDIFALGMTAYRLVTDAYPPPVDPRLDKSGLWRGSGPEPPQARNPRLEGQLGAIIARMLSVRPQARGTAGELAEELEHLKEHAGAMADQRLFLWETEPPTWWTPEETRMADVLGHRRCRRPQERARAVEKQDAEAKAEAERREAQELSLANALTEHVPHPWTPLSRWLLGSAAVAACLTLALAVTQEGQRSWSQPESVRSTADDGGTAGLADSVFADPVQRAVVPQSLSGLKLDMPKRPFPGQLRPDSGGKCSSKGQVPINGGCWFQVANVEPPCEKAGYEWKGGCYYPIYDAPRAPTSGLPSREG
ncbi:serine/threonine protein kinase [Stigmatella erecta]|uniref:serine/threonine protein kinase n=1 Tax=Stigmatella erecta TaxID=83460 RepID=UPI000B039750|nr:serine/threonine-protein kinase [Stigmatella erecta]